MGGLVWHRGQIPRRAVACNAVTQLSLCCIVGCCGLQDWFGTDLKIRRMGQYWTQLEYVLDVSPKYAGMS